MRGRLSLSVVIVGAAVLVAVGALAPVRLEAERHVATTTDGSDALLPVAGRDADGDIDALIGQIEATPDDARLHAQLGLAYLRRARDQADPTSLPLAERALERSLELQGDSNLEAFVGMAALSNARHSFTESVTWSRKAIRTNPHSSSAYGLLGDALFELGDVARADGAYQRMVDVRPEVASYVRASYALQYHGRPRAAIGVMRLALQAAGPSGETAAWVRHQIGDIYAGLGDHDEAARQNRIGIAIAPGYVPPTVGVAESHIASGRLDKALAILEVAARELPALEYMIKLGDLYQAIGDEPKADAQYRAVAKKLAAYRAAGVKADAEFIVFYADHGLRLPAALDEARAAYAERPTQKMADALAWVLHANGRHGEAWRYARRAMHGPARDPAFFSHAAAIAQSLGWDRRAADLTTLPRG